MSEYLVNWALKRNGRVYRSGETVSLDPKDAAPLVKGGVLSPKPAVKTKTGKPKPGAKEK